MNFLEKTLHIKVQVNETIQDYNLPFYFTSLYEIHEAYLDWQEVFFVYPKDELESVSELKNRVKKLQMIKKIPVVFILENITARKREAFIKSGISFVVENKQCYLPFLGTLLTERCDFIMDNEILDKMSPSAQLLLFYYIINNEEDLYSKKALDVLGFSGMTITRAVRQLEKLKLVKTYKEGVNVVLTSEYHGKQLFNKAKEYLINPVRKEIYVNKEYLDDDCVIAGENALSLKSMINPPDVECYAVINNKKWQKIKDEEFYDANKQVKIQIWKYNPLILAENSCIDILSMAMSFSKEKDERIEQTLIDTLDNYWRELDGNRIKQL